MKKNLLWKNRNSNLLGEHTETDIVAELLVLMCGWGIVGAYCAKDRRESCGEAFRVMVKIRDFQTG